MWTQMDTLRLSSDTYPTRQVDSPGMGKRSFGQITRLPSKRYRARYTDPRGAVRPHATKADKAVPVIHAAPTTFDTREDAEAWLTDERRLISGGKWTPPAERAEAARRAREARKARIFEDYARAWLDGKHDLKAATRTSYETSLRVHLNPNFGRLPVDEITPEAVRAWFSSYGDKTPTARAHAYAVLAAVMTQALDDELITRNPCRIKKGAKSKVKREPEVLTLAELLALADAMPDQHRALTLLCGLGGLRFGEAVALRRRDVDLDAGTVNVSRTMVRVDGEKTTNSPKTKAALREVAIPQVVVDAMREHLKTVPVTGREGLVFPGGDGKLLAASALYGLPERVEKRGRRRYVKGAYGFYRARVEIGRPGLHWHDLRRTAATLGAQAGATVREMQHRLGHETPAMALHYQGATAERDKSIADRLQASVDALIKHANVTELGEAK